MQYSGTVFVAAITHWTFFQLQNRIPFELRIPYYFFFLSCFGRSLCTALVGEQSGGSNTKFYVCVYCMRELWSWRALSGAHYQQQPRASWGCPNTGGGGSDTWNHCSRHARPLLAAPSAAEKRSRARCGFPLLFLSFARAWLALWFIFGDRGAF